MAVNLYSDGNLRSRLDLIDPLSRIFIVNIPTHFNKESLKKGCERYGDIEVYAFQNCDYDMGWAWVGYSSRRSVKSLIRHIYRNGSAEKQ